MTVNNNQPADAVNLSAQLNLDQTQASSRTASTGASTAASGASTSADDSVALSSSRAYVQQALTATSPARSARTQELKSLVQTNQYQPNSQEFSQAFVDAHLAGA